VTGGGAKANGRQRDDSRSGITDYSQGNRHCCAGTPSPLPLSLCEGEGRPAAAPRRTEGNVTTREAASRTTRKAIVAAGRDLRRRETTSERLLWNELRNRKLLGRKFRRQARIGHFVVDFYCAAESLVIEIDGGIHARQPVEDRDRQQTLEAMGLRVLRVTAQACEQDRGGILAQIRGALNSLTPGPSPSKEGEGCPKGGVREST
jgi:very-short-patch-repair endonuclease